MTIDISSHAPERFTDGRPLVGEHPYEALWREPREAPVCASYEGQLLTIGVPQSPQNRVSAGFSVPQSARVDVWRFHRGLVALTDRFF